MKEHIYTAKRGKIIRQSFFIWLFVALQVAANMMLIPSFIKRNEIGGIVYINVILSALTVPSVLLFIKYYQYSAGKKFIVTYDSLKFIDDKTGSKIEMLNADIEEIYLVRNLWNSHLPWTFHEYFSFVDKNQNRIIVTSYIMDIGDFWLDTLSRKVNRNKLIIKKRLYPIM